MDTYIPTKNESLNINKVISSKNIAIIGSGIAGIGAAEHLSKNNKDFILFEKFSTESCVCLISVPNNEFFLRPVLSSIIIPFQSSL